MFTLNCGRARKPEIKGIVQFVKRPLSNKLKFECLTCKLPQELNAVLANRIYIKKDGLPSKLLNQIKRLAAFQNPEFYKKQSMRFSTALTPRVICCAEDIQNYLTIPRGCLLIADEERNQLIFNDILNVLEEKRLPIVLTERKEHLETLKQKLQNFVKALGYEEITPESI